jgi:hypothetical protein
MGVDCLDPFTSDGGASTALVSYCLNDRAMASHKLGDGKEAEGNRSVKVHPEPAGI